MESTKETLLRRVPSSWLELHHARANPRGEHRRANWYQRRSSTPSLVNRFTDSFPRCILHPGLKALALERRLAKPKYAAAFSFRDDSSETLLDKGPDRRPFLRRESLRLFFKLIRYLYVCLHFGILFI